MTEEQRERIEAVGRGYNTPNPKWVSVVDPPLSQQVAALSQEVADRLALIEARLADLERRQR